MAWLRSLLFGYALVSAGVGIAGYVSKESMVSMIAGVAAAALVVVGVLVAEKKRMIGYGICLLVSLGLAGRFASGTFKGELYPSGVMFLASVIALGGLIGGHFLGKRNATRSAASANE